MGVALHGAAQRGALRSSDDLEGSSLFYGHALGGMNIEVPWLPDGFPAPDVSNSGETLAGLIQSGFSFGTAV